MNKKIFLLPALLISCLFSCNSSNDEVKVILMAGQSNMEGQDVDWHTLNQNTIDEYQNGHENVLINYDCTYEHRKDQKVPPHTSNGQFVPVKFGQGSKDEFFGPEMGVAKVLGEKDPKTKYYIIKTAEGASALYNEWREEGYCYKYFINDIDNSIKYFKDNNIKFKITALMWMQGESDSSQDAKEGDPWNHYQENMEALINRLNKRYEEYIPGGKLATIDAGIAANGRWPEHKIINQAKKNIAAKSINNYYISLSETLPRNMPDFPWHYNGESYLRLGEEFGRCYLESQRASDIKVILMSGQSNMEGHDAKFDPYDSEKQGLEENSVNDYRENHSNVKIDYDCTYNIRPGENGEPNTSNGNFVDVNFGYGRDDTHFGPEVGFAKYLGENDPNQKYYIIKVAEGSSTCYQDWQENGRCFTRFLDDINAGLEKIKTLNVKYEISAFVWMQGEQDAQSDSEYLNYKNNMTKLLDNIDKNFSKYYSKDGLKIIDGGISTKGTSKHFKEINNAKKELAKSRKNYNYVSISERLPLMNSWHYSNVGYLALGEAFALSYLG